MSFVLDNHKEFVNERAALIAQLFLGDIGATFVGRVSDPEIPFEYFGGWRRKGGGISTIPVGVKATELPVEKEFTWTEKSAALTNLARSEPEALVLVVDTKMTQVYFGWSSSLRLSGRAGTGTRRATLPVVKADAQAIELLKRRLQQPQDQDAA